MFDDLRPTLVQRLTAASYALPVVEALQDLADEVGDMDRHGRSDAEINAHIRDWMDDNEFGYESWVADFERDIAGVPVLQNFDTRKVWKAFGVEEWLFECVRSIAFTDEPSVFFPFAAGYWVEDANTDPPTLIAVMTPLTDPELAARQLVEKHRRVFGKLASGSPKDNEVFNARMLARHRAGMSYKEIAIQNLRDKYPDIITREHKYRAELMRERERVVKAVRAAQDLWKSRGLDSSIGE